MSQPSSTEQSPSYFGQMRGRSALFGALGVFDDAVYAVERALVTAALIAMSAAVCLNILYQFLIVQRATLAAVVAGTSTVFGAVPACVAVLCAGILCRAAWRQSPSVGPVPQAVGVAAAATTVALLIVAVCVLVLPSNVVCAAFVLAGGAATAKSVLDTPSAGPALPLSSRTRVALGGVVVVTVAVSAMALRSVPEGYSWAQKFALFLLLWIAFIGASMATHGGRHLSVDAARKAVPERWRPVYEALSSAVAALFTLGFAYLAWLYTADRLAETTAPGQIPDWLKVLAMPFALGLVSFRFLLLAAGAVAVALLGPAPDTGARS